MTLYDFDSKGQLSKEAYIKFHTKIAKILRPDLKEKALAKLVEQDWEHDSKGKDYITRDELFDALFELGDIWTPNIDKYEYGAFYDHLTKLLKNSKNRNGKTNLINIYSLEGENPYDIM